MVQLRILSSGHQAVVLYILCILTEERFWARCLPLQLHGAVVALVGNVWEVSLVWGGGVGADGHQQGQGHPEHWSNHGTLQMENVSGHYGQMHRWDWLTIQLLHGKRAPSKKIPRSGPPTPPTKLDAILGWYDSLVICMVMIAELCLSYLHHMATHDSSQKCHGNSDTAKEKSWGQEEKFSESSTVHDMEAFPISRKHSPNSLVMRAFWASLAFSLMVSFHSIIFQVTADKPPRLDAKVLSNQFKVRIAAPMKYWKPEDQPEGTTVQYSEEDPRDTWIPCHVHHITWEELVGVLDEAGCERVTLDGAVEGVDGEAEEASQDVEEDHGRDVQQHSPVRHQEEWLSPQIGIDNCFTHDSQSGLVHGGQGAVSLDTTLGGTGILQVVDECADDHWPESHTVFCWVRVKSEMMNEKMHWPLDGFIDYLGQNLTARSLSSLLQ